MEKNWYEVKVVLIKDDADIAIGSLYEAGCNGLIEESSGDKTKITAYFSDKKQIPIIENAAIEIKKVSAGDWQKNWRQWFKPFAIVPGVIVAPSWEKYLAKKGESVITIDPGMAFGTGLHETTKLSAGAIYSRTRTNRVESLLDVGTGSGILAIVARLLGVRVVEAVENDPDAAKVARENFELNNASDIKVASFITDISGHFDIVVANILLNTLLELKAKLTDCVGPHGTLILSGITRDQEEEIMRTFEKDFRHEGTSGQNEWAVMIFTKGE